MKIAVTGASGFVGSYVVHWLLSQTEHEVVAISRSEYTSTHQRLECRKADLYSLLECQEALKGCDAAIYLVHSMAPSSRLSQGNFEDFDFILADNFAKSAEKCGVQTLIYVSGLIPQYRDKKLSSHLKSRLEVEETLDSYKFDSISLRCGIVLGREGSSFAMVKNLVHRLKFIVLPRWTQSPTQAVFIDDLVSVILSCIDKHKGGSKIYDVGSPEVLAYQDLLKKVSQLKGNRNFFFSLPIIPRWLSKLWVSVITGESRELVYPLVDSLVHPMVVRNEYSISNDHQIQWTPIDEAIKKSLEVERRFHSPMKRAEDVKHNTSLVQSVQRLPVPQGWSMKKMARYYAQWLPKFIGPLLKTEIIENHIHIYFRWVSKPLLSLELGERSSFEGRELFYIRGGLLVSPHPKARLEFRSSPQENFFIAAIHSFKPRLPWYIYRYTQAILHKIVMYSFGRSLKRISNYKNNDFK